MGKDKSLEGKKAVITGGSRGIGKAIAQEFLKNGAEVFLVARNAEELAAAKKELSPLGTVMVHTADVSKKDEVAKIAEEIKKSWESIDVLVNAAGVYGPIGSTTDVDADQWLQAIEINLFGTFLAIKFLAPLMKENGGSIINFVGGGEGAYPNFSSYVASKGGVARLTETVAAEFASSHIDVNAIAPGAVNTKFLDDLLATGPEQAGNENYEKSIKQKESGGVSPEKAAKLCVFLASERARGLTGKILSAVWDSYESFPEHLKEITSSDVYTFRRVKPKE
jgi:NAD(P)-dependent dehydrogenase (short-subunit alcohol dehydrogenase family)